MTLQASGQISLSDLRSEYTNLGSKARVAMNDFYYGSTHVKRNKCTDQVRIDGSHPTYSQHFEGIPVLGSGSQIKLTQYYNKVYYFAKQNVVQVRGSNASVDVINIENEAIKKDSNNTVFFDVETTGNCSASSTSNYGLRIPQGSRTHTTCYFTNDYAVYGKGGRGGNGGENGESGGPAFYVSLNLYLKNNNRILGGGGGGGGGSGKTVSYNECYCCNTTNAALGGSGGGGGKGGGYGGARGPIPGANFRFEGAGGGYADNNTSGGSGGAGGSICHGTGAGTICSNSGGNGGGWGESGNPGQSGGSGGSGGNSIERRGSAYYVVLTGGTTAGATVTF